MQFSSASCYFLSLRTKFPCQPSLFKTFILRSSLEVAETNIFSLEIFSYILFTCSFRLFLYVIISSLLLASIFPLTSIDFLSLPSFLSPIVISRLFIRAHQDSNSVSSTHVLLSMILLWISTSLPAILPKEFRHSFLSIITNSVTLT
jgi:hypothetical protein